MESASHDHGFSAFHAVRPRLFGIAYRMLGSAAEADDVVQDVWVRWQTTNRSTVQDPPAYLATSAVRLSINVLQSARSRRESYVGVWLPEPVDTTSDPRLGAERAEALELAVLLLMEKLAPPERAAYILREAFDYPYGRIAEVLQVSEENARQLVSRARKHIAEGRRRPVEAAQQRRLLEAFVDAAQRGDFHGLERLFAADVVSYSDGGGLVRAAQKPIDGRERVAKFISTVTRYWHGITLSFIEANGRPCVLMSREGECAGLASVEASEDGIDQILWFMRPSKLSGISLSSQQLRRVPESL
ncbi:MAG TPA: RNA polymerase sigma-70 factor [Bryobacteraceae bacterium]|nr:RNA polymerase sigma-70 factor [Bryobacteraceae bacterium]